MLPSRAFLISFRTQFNSKGQKGRDSYRARWMRGNRLHEHRENTTFAFDRHRHLQLWPLLPALRTPCGRSVRAAAPWRPWHPLLAGQHRWDRHNRHLRHSARSRLRRVTGVMHVTMSRRPARQVGVGIGAACGRRTPDTPRGVRCRVALDYRLSLLVSDGSHPAPERPVPTVPGVLEQYGQQADGL